LGFFALVGFWGFGLVLLFWAFWCGKLWKGKELLKGKEWLKRG
jgi:hypothetical protein